MAYDKDEILATAITAIEDNNLFFVEDIVAFIPCGKTTFYDLFPVESNDLNALKEKLEQNCINQKVRLRKKWDDTDNATLSLALYKLTGSNEERKRLSQTHHDLTTGGDKIDNKVEVTIKDYSDED